VKLENFFEMFKLPFLLWCMHPLTLGAHVLSELFFKKHAHYLRATTSDGKPLLVQGFNVIVGLGFV